MRCLLKSCPKCNGDLVLDGDEWRCWQCGQYYYPRTSPPASSTAPDRARTCPELAEGADGRRQRARNIDAAVAASIRADQRWWRRNREIIGYLDEGRSVTEIATLVGTGTRYVRVVRERLKDLRINDA